MVCVCRTTSACRFFQGTYTCAWHAQMRHCSCDPTNPGRWVVNNNNNGKRETMGGVLGTRWNLTGSFSSPNHCATGIQNQVKLFEFESLGIWWHRRKCSMYSFVDVEFVQFNGFLLNEFSKQHDLDETWSWLNKWSSQEAELLRLKSNILQLFLNPFQQLRPRPDQPESLGKNEGVGNFSVCLFFFTRKQSLIWTSFYPQ